MGKKITVCIVEDIDEIRIGVKHIIDESERFECPGTFGSAEVALKPISLIRPDIVLMDINLPGMNGIDCVKRIKAQNSGTQFMMFTIYEDNDQIFEALAAGANGYLLKKTPPCKILSALQELYEGGSPMSSHIARKVVLSFRETGKTNNEIQCLSSREKEVLELLAKGYLYKEIGDRLNISTGTVRQHIHKIYEKLHVQNRTEAINKLYGKHYP